METKTCTKCGVERPRTEFYEEARNSDGLRSNCAVCDKAKSRFWRNSNPAAHKEKTKEWKEQNAARVKKAQQKWCAANKDKVKEKERRRNLRRHGLTEEKFGAILAAQGGACAICQRTDPGWNKQNWAVDHCHETGMVRGLLCNSCNTSLGQFGDDPAILQRAIDYLVKARKDYALGVGIADGLSLICRTG